MAVVAHFETFDVEKYGDLLFPPILERRLGMLGHRFMYVSPLDGSPVWNDCVPTVAAGASHARGTPSVTLLKCVLTGSR
jgi:hypothetical protein